MKEVGALWCVAPRTAAFHKYRMMDKLGLKTNAALIPFAIKNQIGLASLPPVTFSFETCHF